MAQHAIQIELEGLIKLLAQNLYADPNVFLREMIQNAHDAIVRRRELAIESGGPTPPAAEIRISTETIERTIVITDNGAGLTREEVHKHLSTIGGSGTLELKRRLESRDRDGAVELIGQFGIGLLSAFIVADKVEFVTRSAREQALRWTSMGNKYYDVEEAGRDEVGTTVRLHLSPENSRFLDPSMLKEIVRTYADIIGIPIYLGEEAQPTNAVDAPWHRNYASEANRLQAYRAYWEDRFEKEHALASWPVDQDFTYLDPPDPVPKRGRIQGVLGVTDRHVPAVNDRGTVDLYILRMFISAANRDVLPPWARFIQGVIDCGNLTPNAARDNVVRNNALEEVRRTIGDLIIARLTALSREEPARLVEIMRWHSYHVLAMCVQDQHEAFFRAVADIVPLMSDQGPITVHEYYKTASRHQDGRFMVYYFTEPGSANQYFMLCQARGMHVFDVSENFAKEFLQRYAQAWPERICLARIDLADSTVIFEPVEPPEMGRFEALERACNLIFPDMRYVAKISRFKPEEVPALLNETRSNEARREMEAIVGNAALPEFFRAPIRKFLKEKRDPLTLHLNANNPIIARLAARPRLDDDLARNAMVSLYNNALMLLSKTISAEDIRVMFQQYNHVVEMLLKGAEVTASLDAKNYGLITQVAELEKRVKELESILKGGKTDELTPCVTCFVAMPFDVPKTEEVYLALEEVLEDAPFFWDVLRADEKTVDSMLWKNVGHQMASAHCFIAEVSDHNANVMIEIGRMEAIGRPLLLIRREGSPALPADLQGRLSLEYNGVGSALVTNLRAGITRQKNFCPQRGERHLSKTVLKRINGLSDGLRGLLASEFDTCTEFLEAKPEQVGRKFGVDALFVQAAQKSLTEFLGSMSGDEA